MELSGKNDLWSFGYDPAWIQATQSFDLAPVQRELDRMIRLAPTEIAALVTEVETDNAAYPEAAHVYRAGELRLLRAIQHIVVPHMLRCLSN